MIASADLSMYGAIPADTAQLSDDCAVNMGFAP